jgi:KaiC/GvpD/RAD55 family RecA-like ATPase
VSTNKPLKALIENFKREKIDFKNFYFVDAITKTSNSEVIEGENFFYVDSPKNLIDLSIAIETGMEKIKGQTRFLVFDSLSTLLVYNKPGVVARFAHSLASKIRAWKAKGIFLIIQEKDEKITKIIAQFCDEAIELGKKN